MEYVKTQNIESVGAFEYYLTVTSKESEDGAVITYGVAVKDMNDCYTECVEDIWTEKEPIVSFINLLAENNVTCVHLKEICEEFAEDLYSI